MGKKDKKTNKFDDFYERKYRIFSDYLNNFKNTIDFKGVDYKTYFIKHFEYEFVYSLKLYCLSEAFNFSLSAKASFIRRSIESYVYINLAKNDLLDTEHYKLFKFKLKENRDLIGKKEQDQILKKFYLNKCDFFSFLDSHDKVFMFGITSQNTSYDHVKYYFENVDDPNFNKEEILDTYNKLGVIIHHNLVSDIKYKNFYINKYNKIVSNIVRPILINKIGKEYENSISKNLKTEKIDINKFSKLLTESMSHFYSLFFNRKYFNEGLVTNDQELYFEFMKFILDYLENFLFLYYFKEFFSFECFFKSFLEKCSLYYSLFKLKDDNLVEAKDLKLIMNYYESLIIKRLGENIDFNNNDEDYVFSLIAKYSKYGNDLNKLKNNINKNPKIILGIYDISYSKVVKEFLLDFIENKEFVEDIFLTYQNSISASHSNGDYLTKKDENDVSKFRDIIFIFGRILKKVSEETKVYDFEFKKHEKVIEEHSKVLEDYNNGDRGFKRYLEKQGFNNKLTEKLDGIEEFVTKKINEYNETIDKEVDNFLVKLDNIVTKIDKMNRVN